jgi:hypothetical protein
LGDRTKWRGVADARGGPERQTYYYVIGNIAARCVWRCFNMNAMRADIAQRWRARRCRA